MSHTINIGGVEDCVFMSVSYSPDNKPIKANLGLVEYSNKCTSQANLGKGGGTRIMINAILEYVHTSIFKGESIDVSFDDMSRIECATEDDIIIARNRFPNLRERALIQPVELNLFSIAFNGCTWYEKYFNASLENEEDHQKYRENVEKLLKHKPTIQELGLNSETLPLLLDIYESNITFQQLCHKIPIKDRCYHAQMWLISYVNSQIKYFQNKGWIIKLPMAMRGGSKGKGSRKYYCPKGFMRSYSTRRK